MTSLQQALDFHRTGQLPEAEQAYRAVLTRQPRQPDALSLLGVVLEALGRPEEAVKCIRKAVALDPQAPLFRLHLGNALLAAKQPEQAAAELRLAARMQPNLAEAHYNLGNALRQCGDHDGAIAAYRDCLNRAPDFHLARNNTALLLSARGDYDAAFAELQIITAADPLNIQAHVNIANIADEAGRHEFSYQAAQTAASLDPQHPDALFVLGLASIRLGKEAEALQAYERLTAVAPDNYGGWDNYAQALQAYGRFQEAEAAYQSAHALVPDDADVNYHIALLDLLLGRLGTGFKDYAWRFKAVKKLKRIEHVSAPLWDGGDPNGKTILAVDEQGFGDSIMFCRYLPLLRARGARVIYACRAPMMSLLRGWDGADQLTPFDQAAQTPCDAHVSLLDLPHLLGTHEKNVPCRTPYLTAPPGDAPGIAADEKNLRVGIAWSGNKNHKHDHRRSIGFDRFAAIFGVPGVRYYNLMRPADLRGGEAGQFARYGIADLGAQIGDFADTARFIQALDLVIAVDTSTVHLAGALGKPVWVLLPLGPDWRWQTERSDSPWYPSAKLYRQQRLDDWEEVLARLKADLAARTAMRVLSVKRDQEPL